MCRPLKVLILTLMTVTVWPIAGCEDRGTFEEAGEEIDEALEEAGDEIEDAGDKIEDATDPDRNDGGA